MIDDVFGRIVEIRSIGKSEGVGSGRDGYKKETGFMDG